MKIIADFSLIPIGTSSISMSEYICECAKIIQSRQSGKIKWSMHASGTELEGEYDDVMALIKECMQACERRGAGRLHVGVRMNYRQDGKLDMEGQVRRVQEMMGATGGNRGGAREE